VVYYLHMRNKFVIAIVLIIIIVMAVLIGIKKYAQTTIAAISNFEECTIAGYPILESYPPQCKTPDGRTFVQNIGNEMDKSDLIRIDSPRPNTAISNPLTITGQARGNWYFEASFPLELVDSNGVVIAQSHAEALAEWMTTEFVPFEAKLTYTSSRDQNGELILRKDNPSGLSQNDNELRIPVFIKQTVQGTATSSPGTQLTACRPTGCSGQICAEGDMVSTCEYRAEYACYNKPFAKCERQQNGLCGWTANAQLQACLTNPPSLE